MDLESVKTDIEIVHKIIGEWQRTGRLSGIGRAFLLDKLKEIQAAVEMQDAECEPQAVECELHEAAPERESPALETFEIFEITEVPETPEDSETPETHEAAGITEMPGVPVTAEAEVVSAPSGDEYPATADTPRRGRLDRKAIRSLYDDTPEEDECTGEVEAGMESGTEEPPKEEFAGETEPVRDAMPRHIDFTAHKKAVLGEVINQGGRTVGDAIVPQAKKKIEAEKVSDLKMAIGVNDRYLIIRDLFGGDADAFDEAVALLNGFDDLDDAMLFIHDNYRWDNGSDGAKLLIDIIVRKLM